MSRIVLRRMMVGLAAALIVGCLLLTLAGCTVWLGLQLAVPGLLLLVVVFGESWRYQRLQPKGPGSGWIATDQRFVDPESGKLVTVFHRPSTGERRYVGCWARARNWRSHGEGSA